MRFVIVTGMSGAGKTSVLKFLEDINFFCVDNIPPALLPKFAELCYEQEGEIERVAMGLIFVAGSCLMTCLRYCLICSIRDMNMRFYSWMPRMMC